MKKLLYLLPLFLVSCQDQILDTSSSIPLDLQANVEVPLTRAHHISSLSSISVQSYYNSTLYFDDVFTPGDVCSSNYYHLDGSIYYRPVNATLSYYSSNIPYTLTDGVMHASYTLPDVYSQQDLLFATTISSEDHVHLDYKHALASVQFKYDLRKQDRTISSITISDTPLSGSLTFNGSFSWSASSYGSFTLDLDKLCPEGSTTIDVTSNSENTLFFLIPLGDPLFTVTYSTGEVLSASLSDLSTLTLSPGVNYIINLNDIGLPSIDIDDTVTSLTKSDAVVTNTSHNPGYIQVVMSANYIDNNGISISPCPLNLTLNPDWSYSNGIYTYSKRLNGGESTSPIFQPYTVDLIEGATSVKWDILVICKEQL